jgi:thiol-disulfide isomerase/thioredoxin
MKRLAVVLILVVAVSSAHAAKWKKAIGDSFPGFEATDLLTSQSIKLSDVLAKSEVQGAVVFFTSYRCPVAGAYEARINELAEKYKGKVPFIGLNANSASETAEEQTARAKESGFKFLIGIDQDSKTAKEIGAGVTPEFYLLDKKGKVVYHGPFDDSQDPQHIEKNYLPSAIEAFTAGKEIPKDDQEVQAFGCGISYPKKDK